MQFHYHDTVITVTEAELVGDYYLLRWGPYVKYVRISDLTPIE